MKPRRLSSLLLGLLVALSGPGRVGAQEAGRAIPERRDFLVRNWQTDDGLPRNIINAIAQDQRGFLWFGTPQGLIRFDGARFLAQEGEASPELAQGFVQALQAARDGSLWIATRRSGLFLSQAGGITAPRPEWLGSAVDSVAEDGRGVIWVTDGNGRLGRWEEGKFVATAELARVATGTTMRFELLTDARGGLWFYKQDTFG